ncbi:glutathione S-transferase [Sandaracinobacter sp.]|jgi:glutathione S-transferase|uniref:glutathione S-transferase family protein n=1 Tax=Sandaracinobacter sp. TaxID=2487581 RepID=UPI0035B13782
MKLIIANRRYSSWSLRGWLAAKQSGLPFQEEMADIYAPDWQSRRAEGVFAQANGKVPILIDGESVIWNALAIIDWLDRKSGGTRFWPADGPARAFATSAAAEMQAGFLALRQNCPMNCMRHYPGWTLAPEAGADVARVDQLWQTGLASFGGPWLGGNQWGGADILFAPVASRLTTYDVKLSPAADAYRKRVMAHPHVADWVNAAASETRLQPTYEY